MLDFSYQTDVMIIKISHSIVIKFCRIRYFNF